MHLRSEVENSEPPESYDLEAVTALIKTIVVAVTEVDPALVVPSANIREDLGADSLDIVEMIVALSRKIDIQICDQDVCMIRTVGEATTYVHQALAAKSIPAERIES